MSVQNFNSLAYTKGQTVESVAFMAFLLFGHRAQCRLTNARPHVVRQPVQDSMILDHNLLPCSKEVGYQSARNKLLNLLLWLALGITTLPATRARSCILAYFKKTAFFVLL